MKELYKVSNPRVCRSLDMTSVMNLTMKDIPGFSFIKHLKLRFPQIFSSTQILTNQSNPFLVFEKNLNLRTFMKPKPDVLI